LTVPQKSGKSARQRADDPIEHPELFEELRQLRRSMAEARSVPPYVICSDATLKDMTRLRPSSVDRLSAVSGIGTHKQATYGRMFVDCLVSWCQKHGVTMDAAPEAAPKPVESSKRSRSHGSYLAESMFERGLTVAEVAAEMKRAPSTVSGYLGEYLTSKKVTDPARWVPLEVQGEVEAAIELIGPRPLKLLFEHLNGRIDYDTLKIVVTCWENRKHDTRATGFIPVERPRSVPRG
jgi:ATP-dependent DNA helicase RecQ